MTYCSPFCIDLVLTSPMNRCSNRPKGWNRQAIHEIQMKQQTLQTCYLLYSGTQPNQPSGYQPMNINGRRGLLANICTQRTVNCSSYITSVCLHTFPHSIYFLRECYQLSFIIALIST